MSTAVRPRVGAVILTQGKRPDDLRAAIDSVLSQQGVDVDVVCVGNGWAPVDLPEGVATLALPENLGIPAGRNAGVPHVSGDLLLFVDDDARLVDTDFLARASELFAGDRRLGVVQPRVESPGEKAPTRWIPRMRKGDPRRSSPAFSLWEGVLVVRRAAFDAAGGWGDEYFYAHEGIELAWRVWDAGYEVWYRGDLRCAHPAIDASIRTPLMLQTVLQRGPRPDPTRAPVAIRFTARTVGLAERRQSLRLSPREDIDPFGAVSAAIGGIWGMREDRYSELRTLETAARPKVEMSYIGG